MHVHGLARLLRERDAQGLADLGPAGRPHEAAVPLAVRLEVGERLPDLLGRTLDLDLRPDLSREYVPLPLSVG